MMKLWLILFFTKREGNGYAIIAACTSKQAQDILLSQATEVEDPYLILTILELDLSELCNYHIVSKGVTTHGLSAYELALEHGFVGSYEDWRESFKGEKGEKGDSPTIFIDQEGYWWINGECTYVLSTGVLGDKGEQGEAGQDGLTPFINNDGYWQIGKTVTTIKAEGKTPIKGVDYFDGKALTWDDLTDELKKELKGSKGDPFTFDDFTPEQLELLKGQDGATIIMGSASITISDDGYWIIDGENTGIKAQGPEGKQGPKGDSITWDDLTDENKEEIRGPQGPKGDTFTWEDLTEEQKASIKGEKGDTGNDGTNGNDGDGIAATVVVHTLVLDTKNGATGEINGSVSEGYGFEALEEKLHELATMIEEHDNIYNGGSASTEEIDYIRTIGT